MHETTGEFQVIRHRFQHCHQFSRCLSINNQSVNTRKKTLRRLTSISQSTMNRHTANVVEWKSVTWHGARSTSATWRTSAGSELGTSLSGSVHPSASGKMGRTVFASWRHIGHQNSLWMSTRPCTAWPYNNNDGNYFHCGTTVWNLCRIYYCRRQNFD